MALVEFCLLWVVFTFPTFSFLCYTGSSCLGPSSVFFFFVVFFPEALSLQDHVYSSVVGKLLPQRGNPLNLHPRPAEIL